VGSDSIQGDIAFVDAARSMGAQVKSGPGWLEAHRGRWPLAGITLDAVAIPDAAMTLAVMGLYADTPSRIGGIASWRVKETDRIAAMATELRKLGAEVDAGADRLTVSAPPRFVPATIATYDDHRMAMCFSLAALGGIRVRILDPECVAKTFPGYFAVFERVVIR
jgi:3-phosphoshikimate 1-carboxyvinyltransferase